MNQFKWILSLMVCSSLFFIVGCGDDQVENPVDSESLVQKDLPEDEIDWKDPKYLESLEKVKKSMIDQMGKTGLAVRDLRAYLIELKLKYADLSDEEFAKVLETDAVYQNLKAAEKTALDMLDLSRAQAAMAHQRPLAEQMIKRRKVGQKLVADWEAETKKNYDALVARQIKQYNDSVSDPTKKLSLEKKADESSVVTGTPPVEKDKTSVKESTAEKSNETAPVAPVAQGGE